MSLMLELKIAVDRQICPHFWISSINLFDIEPKVSEKRFQKLSRRLDKIMLNPHWYIPYAETFERNERFNRQKNQ